MPNIDSTSVGDPARFPSPNALETGLAALPPAPRDVGHLEHIVSRRDGGRRERLASAELTIEGGVPGDAWFRKPDKTPEGQITVMETRVAELLAGGQPLDLFGDNFFVDFDLSSESLAIGERLRIGGATLEVTPKPHNGCSKFAGRFGLDTLKFIAAPVRRSRNLRGIYLRVIEAGKVAVGDRVERCGKSTAGAIDPRDRFPRENSD